MSTIADELKPRIVARESFTSPWIIAYTTKGGTYMIASNGKWNDSGKPRDLMAVRADGTALVLRPTVDPDFVNELRALLAEAR